MTHEQFEREKNYRVSLCIAKAMLAQGLITPHDYKRIDSLLIEKYNPQVGSLCPQIA